MFLYKCLLIYPFSRLLTAIFPKCATIYTQNDAFKAKIVQNSLSSLLDKFICLDKNFPKYVYFCGFGRNVGTSFFSSITLNSYLMSDRVERWPKPQNKPNYIYSIISVALVLFLIGFFGLVILHAQRLVTIFKERVNVMVELENGTDKNDVFALKSKLDASPYVKKGSVVFTSKEDAVELLREDFGEDFLKMEFQNPLYDVLSFNLKAEFMEESKLAEIKASIEMNQYVNDVYYQEGLVEDISRNIRKIGFLALAIGFLFLIVALTLIHNTIKLALYANRFLIKNMELVGASWGFISRPYFLRSMKNGLYSGMIAVSLLLMLLLLAQQDLPELRELEDPFLFSLLFLALILMGIIISGGSTWYIVNKYLRMRTDDLY